MPAHPPHHYHHIYHHNHCTLAQYIFFSSFHAKSAMCMHCCCLLFWTFARIKCIHHHSRHACKGNILKGSLMYQSKKTLPQPHKPPFSSPLAKNQPSLLRECQEESQFPIR